MRVLVLTKQLYMGKDLLADRFGRFYEIPKMLAGCGNEIRCVCLKYRSTADRPPHTESHFDNVQWDSYLLGPNWPAGLFRQYRRLKKVATEFKPDVIVGMSDSLHVIMASFLSTKFAIPLVVDLYDNFESYGATRIPGMKSGLKRGIRVASAVSVVSDNLAAKVRNEYRALGIVRTVTNAICPEIFYSIEKKIARKRLGLPQAGVLIGTAGALTGDRGIVALYGGFTALSKKFDNLYLVLAGPRDDQSKIPNDPNIIDLGEVPQFQVGSLFNALDVGVICNRKNAFGTYCFPQKLYEMLACELPVVAADVDVMRRLFVGAERFLYDPERPNTLIEAVTAQLNAAYVPPIPIPTWKDQGVLFNDLLGHAAATSPQGKSSGVRALSERQISF